MKDYDRNRGGYKPSKAVGREASEVSEQNPSGSTWISLEDIRLISNTSPGDSPSNDHNKPPSALSTAESYLWLLPSQRHDLLFNALESQYLALAWHLSSQSSAEATPDAGC